MKEIGASEPPPSRSDGIPQTSLWSSRNWWFLAFAAATLLTPPVRVEFAGGVFHFAMVFGLAGVCVGLWRRQQWRLSFRAPASAMVVTVAVFTVSCGLALIYSGLAVAAGSLVRTALFGLSVYAFLYFRDGPGAESDPAFIVKWMLRFAALAALFGCLDFYFQWNPVAPFADQFVLGLKIRRAQGLFYEAGHFGNFCVFFLIGVAALWSQRERLRLSPFLLSVLATVLIAGLAFSFSRSSALNLLAGLVTLGVLLVRRNEKMGLLRFIAIAAGIGLALYYVAPLASTHAVDRLAGTVSQAFADPEILLGARLESWKFIVGFLVDHPWHLIFGVGFKSLPYSEFIGRPVVADNTYVSLLAETGVVGLTAAAYMLAGILRTAYLASKSANETTASLGLWSLAFWVGQLVQMLWLDSLTYWRVLPLYLVVLALAARDENSRPRPVR